MAQEAHNDTAYGNTKKEFLTAVSKEDRLRSWFLTINTYQECQIEKLKSIKCKYIIFQTEMGGKKKRHHIHACITYQNPIRFNTMKEEFPTANIGRVRNLTKAREYCAKEKTWTGLRYERIDNTVKQDIDDRTSYTTEIVPKMCTCCGQVDLNKLDIEKKKDRKLWLDHYVYGKLEKWWWHHVDKHGSIDNWQESIYPDDPCEDWIDSQTSWDI